MSHIDVLFHFCSYFSPNCKSQVVSRNTLENLPCYKWQIASSGCPHTAASSFWFPRVGTAMPMFAQTSVLKPNFSKSCFAKFPIIRWNNEQLYFPWRLRKFDQSRSFLNLLLLIFAPVSKPQQDLGLILKRLVKCSTTSYDYLVQSQHEII